MKGKKERCGECIYRAEPAKNWKCNYMTITGVSRKAQLPEACTYFKRGDRLDGRKAVAQALKARRDKPQKPKPTKYDWAPARRLYNEGKNDSEISRFMQCPAQTVRSWRKREKLKANAEVGGRRR